MKNQISKYGPMLLSNAGRCRKCLHGSLGMAMLAWCAVAVSAYLHPGSAFGILASALAIAATVLWIIHAVAFTLRVIADIADNHASDLSRRHTLTNLGRIAGLGLLVSAPIIFWPSGAFAFCGQCTKDSDCGSANSGWVCKNTAPVNSGEVCNECVKS